jgi:hypothetical protein
MLIAVAQLTQEDLVVAMILGVLLPALLTRPAHLSSLPESDHRRRRHEIAYTMLAFAGASYVYVTALTLLHPHVTGQAKRAIFGAGLIVFVLLVINHIPPLLRLSSSGWRSTTTALQVLSAMLFSLIAGGFFAVDQLEYARGGLPPVAIASWLGVTSAMFGIRLWFGPAPGQRMMRYRLARQLRQRRRRLARRRAAGEPTNSQMAARDIRRKPRAEPQTDD